MSEDLLAQAEKDVDQPIDWDVLGLFLAAKYYGEARAVAGKNPAALALVRYYDVA